ncbi:SMP-30/gluconolactonase/LRE family protein [Streptomyces sp. NPDC058457]|uniref:SMP-30/gluconolactonase/LRE family protein n=1 Tax=Streptomyces sp. NPDC058457 TaxID=3346507 RepID=UPI00365AA740
MKNVIAATDGKYQLAEGPVWDAPRQRLLWVDISGGLVLEGTLDGDRIAVTREHRFDEMVSAVAAAEDGTLVVAALQHLVVVHPDGTRTDGPRVIPAGAGRRLNDGGTDPAGRFLVGSLRLDGRSESEVLVRWEQDGRLTPLDKDLTLSNGLAWSADGTLMYSVDTLRRTVFVRDYDAETGSVGERRVHVQLDDGYPDGIVLDAAGHLWVAVYGAGEVRCYAPDGTLSDRLVVPAPHTTSVAFAGPDLHTLVITTATPETDDPRRPATPDSGRLFTVRTAVPGLPVAAWAPPIV